MAVVGRSNAGRTATPNRERKAMHPALEVEPLIDALSGPDVCTTSCYVSPSAAAPIAAPVVKVAVEDNGSGVNAGVSEEIGRRDAEQTDGAKIVVVGYHYILHGREVIGLTVGEGFAVKGVVGPCAHAVSATQRAVGHEDAVYYLFLGVGVSRAPCDECYGFASASYAAVDGAMLYGDTSRTMGGSIVVCAPRGDGNTWISVGGREGHTVVVGGIEAA